MVVSWSPRSMAKNDATISDHPSGIFCVAAGRARSVGVTLVVVAGDCFCCGANGLEINGAVLR